MTVPTESCVGCRNGVAATSVNGARLCWNCNRLVEIHGGGEKGLEVLMRLGTLGAEPLHHEFRATGADGQEQCWYWPEPIRYLEP
jgi:hypothetical protein